MWNTHPTLRISGVYISIESPGAAITTVDVRNYNVFDEKG